jgi:hypothetical protein
MKKTLKQKPSVAELIDLVWQADQRTRRIKIVHRALWHFVNDVCSENFPKQEKSELYEMLQMLKHHHDRLEDFLGEATKYCDDLEQ